ncbi:hypothetical protein V7111_01385 [Neobacillus niacini]|uniref:hypothetical protein n=1 Tax=Neobacillus niacini TaxID=86668 RepID=UPI002FFED763
MFKLTVYKKVNLSRNLRLFIFIICLLAVGGKIVFAHEKIDDYREAMKLFESGELIAAEKQFQLARKNPFVTDHNQEMDQILSILTPIKEEMEEIDEQGQDYFEENQLAELVQTYERWQENAIKWLAGTAIQQDMYGEMLVKTKLEKDFHDYFSKSKTSLAASLKDPADEESVYQDFMLIPADYYGGDSAKVNEVEALFIQYYSLKMQPLFSNENTSSIVEEGSRQLKMLSTFSMDTEWLKNSLDSNLLRVLTKAMNKEDYAAFAEQATSVKKLPSLMAESKVIAFIETSQNNLLTKAKNLRDKNKFEEALSIYQGLMPLEDTSMQIADAEWEWDKFEPIRVLKRQYPGKEFPQTINGRNIFGAESVVAAISNEGILYIGKLKGQEPMAISETKLVNAPVIEKLVFQNDLSENPVILIEAKSQQRAHRYLAFEIRNNFIENILDIEANNLAIEAPGQLLLDNPVGKGEAEFAYYERGIDGVYRFSKIKVDYIDISVKEILNYQGMKVRFNGYVQRLNTNQVVLLSEKYNYDTNQYERSYLVVRGATVPGTDTFRSLIGTFTTYETMFDEYGQSIEVPVFTVEKVE